MFKIPRYPIFRLLLALFALAALPSCLDEPEDPPLTMDDVENNFPVVLGNISQWQASYNFSRFQSIWMQQLAGVNADALLAGRYEPQPVHFNDTWTAHYLYCLFPLQSIVETSEEHGAWAYAGMAKILQAYVVGLMTDAWGDIPLTELSHVDDQRLPSPKYDTQERILEEIFLLLDEGKADLQKAPSGQSYLPDQTTDLIYGGDAGKWIRAANVLRLRYLLRLGHYHGNYSELTTAMQTLELFRSNDDDMLFRYAGTNQQTLNPVYYQETNIRYTRVGKYFVDLLKGNGDPRLPRLVRRNPENEFVGSAPGERNLNASQVGPSLASPDSPVVFLSFAEQKFIEAEMHLRNIQRRDAEEAFRQGVIASLDFHNARDAAWEAEYAEIGFVNLEQVIKEKYVALFLQPEVWADYRRTGFPRITPFEPSQNTIPRRMLYPQDELDFNPVNVPQNITLFDRVWWDKL
jgi:hypothetical protein